MLAVGVGESAEVRIAGLEALLAERDARIVELEDRVAYLAGLVEEVRREGKRQAAPFRKALKAKPERPGRKPGGGDGAHSFRRPPVRDCNGNGVTARSMVLGLAWPEER